MDEYYERRVSSAVIWSRRLAVFALVLLLVGGTGHRIGYLASSDILPVLGVVAAIALLSLLTGVRALALFWRYGGKGGGSLVFAVLVALLVATPFVMTAYRGITLPMLSDVSTDTDDPPELLRAAADRTADMNPIEPFTLERRVLQEAAYPNASGRRYEAPIGQVLEVVLDAVDERGWRVVGPSEFPAEVTEVTIEAEARSPVLGMPADIAVRLMDEGTSTYVDMRSSTRYWGHDFGDNAKRIESFMRALDAEVAYLAVISPVETVEPPPPKAPEPSPLPEEPAAPLDRSEDPPD